MDVIEQADLLVYMEVGEVTKEVKKVDQQQDESRMKAGLKVEDGGNDDDGDC